MPEAMPSDGAEIAQDGQDDWYVPGSIWVGGVARHPHETIFRERTGRSGGLPGLAKPAMGCVVVEVHRIRQGQQEVHVQQIGSAHGVSSRNCLDQSQGSRVPLSLPEGVAWVSRSVTGRGSCGRRKGARNVHDARLRQPAGAPASICASCKDIFQHLARALHSPTTAERGTQVRGGPSGVP
jgi:hypothetical protein